MGVGVGHESGVGHGSGRGGKEFSIALYDVMGSVHSSDSEVQPGKLSSASHEY